MAFDVKAFFDPTTSTVTYLVWDVATGEAAVIDPVLDYEPRAAKVSTKSAEAVLKAVAERRLNPQMDPGNPCPRRPPLGGRPPEARNRREGGDR